MIRKGGEGKFSLRCCTSGPSRRRAGVLSDRYRQVECPNRFSYPRSLPVPLGILSRLDVLHGLTEVRCQDQNSAAEGEAKRRRAQWQHQFTLCYVSSLHCAMPRVGQEKPHRCPPLALGDLTTHDEAYLSFISGTREHLTRDLLIRKVNYVSSHRAKPREPDMIIEAVARTYRQGCNR